MARPRIFLSSTFYDLRFIRADLEEFIKQFGYEPVLHERGGVPYGREDELEKYCYDEISNCDILVSIVGNRFGAESRREQGMSISQVEHSVAHKNNKQLYVFVDKSVDTEYQFYLKNKNNGAKITWTSVDDPRVFEFLERIRALQFNNAICAFDHVSDIKAFLRDQWAGLFQRLLRDQERKREAALVQELSSSIRAVTDLIKLVDSTSERQSQAFDEILLSNHPIFEVLKRVTNVQYRVFFKNKEEMSTWLKARGYSEDEFLVDEGRFEWSRFDTPSKGRKTHKMISVSKSLFGPGGELKRILPADWNESFVQFTETPMEINKIDDDIPF
jgi:hypothetical protein